MLPAFIPKKKGSQLIIETNAFFLFACGSVRGSQRFQIVSRNGHSAPDTLHSLLALCITSGVIKLILILITETPHGKQMQWWLMMGAPQRPRSRPAGPPSGNALGRTLAGWASEKEENSREF